MGSRRRSFRVTAHDYPLAIEGSEGITALAINQGGTLLAVANRTDHGMITIYNIKSVRKETILKPKVHLSSEEHSSKEYVSLCFGNEPKTKKLISLVCFPIIG